MINCDLFDVHVDELVRAQVGEAGLRQQMLDHVRRCPHCSIRLSEAQEVRAALGSLAAAYKGEQAPARVEAALLTCLREQRRPPRKRRSERRLAAAAAAIIAAGAGVWSWQHFSPPLRSPLTAAQSAPPARSAQLAKVRQNAPPRVHSRIKAAVAQASYPAEEAGFILLPYGQDAPLSGGAQIVRVAVTPAALASMGVPVADPSAAAYLEAEIVVGDDGVARAIRLGGDSGQ